MNKPASFWASFLRSEWKNVVKLCLPPLFIIFITCCLLHESNQMSGSILNVRSWPTVQNAEKPGQYVYQALIFAVVTLVCINTIIYSGDSFEHVETGGRGGADTGRLVLYFSLFCIAVVILWGVEIIWGIFVLKGHAYEWIALGVFTLFSFLDFKLYKSTNQQLNSFVQQGTGEDKHAKELALKAQGFLLQLLFVDIPVVLGILAVLGLLAFFLEGSQALGTGIGANAYMKGFSTGAVVMHMAASQAIFFFVYMNYYVQKFKLKQSLGVKIPDPLRKGGTGGKRVVQRR